jgi:uncharacterized protein YjbI with pentapeptide repeats
VLGKSRGSFRHDADLGLAGAFHPSTILEAAHGADNVAEPLSDTKCRKLSLRGANLTLATLKDADLRGADLHDANLQDADLNGARLPERVGVPSGWQLNGILHTLQRVPQ